MVRQSLFERMMREYRVILAIITAAALYGVIAFITMPRQEFPEFTIRQGLVIGVMPGADSHQVEERLTRPLEQYLFGYKEVNKAKTYSMSQEGRAIVVVELNENVRGLEAPAFWAKLRHGLNELKNQSLPAQVVALVGNNDFGDTSALLLTIVSEGHSLRDVERQLRVLEDHLRRLPATSKVKRVGEQREVIRVTVDEYQLARYGIKPTTFWAVLQSKTNIPTGFRVDGSSLEMPVHVGEAISSEQALESLILISLPSGQNIRLKDVATLCREYGHDDSTVRYNGKEALVVSVEMQPGNDITQYGKEVDLVLGKVERLLPPSVKIARIADQPKAVRNSVNHFMRDFIIAIVSVIGVTMMLLPLRVASVAAITIPVSIAISLGILKGLGVELQTVSLAGLIVVLGMVVDNAIVVVDDHVERLDHGETPWAAAWQSAKGLMIPLLVATAAIIMAYVPLAWFLTGQAADFVASLPLTIMVALIVSLVLAVTLVPILDFWFIKKGIHRHTESGRPTVLDRLDRFYGSALDKAFRHPWLMILGLGLGSVIAAGALATRLDQQLFPKVDRDQFAVEVYLPPGRPLTQTDAIVRDLEKMLHADKRVTNVTSFVGSGSPRFHTLYAPEMPNRNYAQLIVNTISDNATVEVLREYSSRHNASFPDAWVRWRQLDMQAAKAPIEIRITGDNIASLKTLGERIKAHASTLPGVTWVRDDFGDNRTSIEVSPDMDACSRLGVSPSVLQLSLALTSNAGIPLGTLWEGDYPVPVIAAKAPHHLDRVENLQQALVPSMFVGAPVPIRQIAAVRPSWDEGTIVRRNGVRTLTVRVDIEMGRVSSDYQKQMESFIGTLGNTPGVDITFGGERQDQEEQYPPMSKSLLTSIAIIYLILLLQFRRHLKALLVMLTMPLASLGAVVGLLVINAPFGFTSFVGIISLMGIVVRNGVILIDHAESLRRTEHVSAKEAALSAGKRRMRPIFLTSAAAAVGVVPMIVSGSTLWGPLGAVTAFGLVFSMILTLFVLPIAYWLVSRAEHDVSPLDGPPPSSSAAQAIALILLLGIALTPRSAAAQDAPLTLERCRELAARQAAEVRIAELDVSSAERTRDAARTRYFPQVSANANVVRSGSPLATMQTPGATMPVVDGTGADTGQTVASAEGEANLAKRIDSFGVTAIQPVYSGGKIINGNRLATLGIQVAKENAVIARRDAMFLAEEKYWGIHQLQEKLRTLDLYQKLLSELQKQADDAMINGLTTKNDSLKVATLRSKSAVDRLRLESRLRAATRDLSRHLGIPDDREITLAEISSLPTPPSSSKTERANGLEKRPEIRQLERAVQSGALQVSLKRGEMMPTVAVGISAMHNRVSGLKDYEDALAFVTVNVPISGLWEHSSTTKAEFFKKRVSETRLEDARAKIRIEIEKRWDDYETAWKALLAAKEAIEQAAVNLQEESDRYQNGLADFSDMLKAQVHIQQCRDHHTDSIADYWIQRSAYRRAVGDL